MVVTSLGGMTLRSRSQTIGSLSTLGRTRPTGIARPLAKQINIDYRGIAHEPFLHLERPMVGRPPRPTGVTCDWEFTALSLGVNTYKAPYGKQFYLNTRSLRLKTSRLKTIDIVISCR